MKRLAVSLVSLVLSLAVVLGSPSTLNALPPPCPDGQQFMACIGDCPFDEYGYCLALAGNPPNCRVTASWCWDFGPCGALYPYDTPNQIVCDYASG
jgi:hypothetical protein